MIIEILLSIVVFHYSVSHAVALVSRWQVSEFAFIWLLEKQSKIFDYGEHLKRHQKRLSHITIHFYAEFQSICRISDCGTKFGQKIKILRNKH